MLQFIRLAKVAFIGFVTCLATGQVFAEPTPAFECRQQVNSPPTSCYWYEGEELIASGNLRTVARYLRRGGDPNSLTSFDPCHFDFRNSLLSVACIQKQFAIVRLLLAHGANVNRVPGEYQFPLWWAADSGNLRIVQELVRHQAKIDAQVDGNGTTALHVAIHGKHPDVVRYLVDCGADTTRNTLDSNPWGIYEATPMDLARRCKIIECEQALQGTNKVSVTDARCANPTQS